MTRKQAAKLLRARQALRNLTQHGQFTRDDMVDVEQAARMLESVLGQPTPAGSPRYKVLDGPPPMPKVQRTPLPAWVHVGWEPSQWEG